MINKIPLKFANSQAINPANGISRNGFLILLEENGITLDESRMAEVNYYFNLWGDTMKQNRKSGQPYDFGAYLVWMKTGNGSCFTMV